MDMQQHLPGSDPSTSLKNPVSLHTRPPFPMQAQPWPGLASKMEPRPDHGEASYRGSGRLEGRRELTGGFGFRMPESDRSAVEGMAIARGPKDPNGRG